MSRRVWFARDCQLTADPRIAAIGDEHGPGGVLVVEEIFALAKLADDGGNVTVGHATLARRAWVTTVEAQAIVATAVDEGIIEITSGGDRRVIMRVLKHRKWNPNDPTASERKARQRHGESHGGERAIDRDNAVTKPGQERDSVTVPSRPLARAPRTPTPTPTEEGKPSSSEIDKSRREVEGLCQHLADLVIANGARRGQTVVTDSWRRECRLLLDRDGVAPDRVRAVIEWCQADEFWRSNVLSMPKLREKFDQLSAKEQAGRPKARPARRMHPATTDELRQLNERKTA